MGVCVRRPQERREAGPPAPDRVRPAGQGGCRAGARRARPHAQEPPPMDLTGVADVSARVAVIEQRLQFSSPFASVLEQVSQARGSGSITPDPTGGSTLPTGQASSGGDSLAAYLLGERLGSTGTTAVGGAGGGTQ